MLAADEEHTFAKPKPLSHKVSPPDAIVSSASTDGGHQSKRSVTPYKPSSCSICCLTFTFLLALAFFGLASLGPRYADRAIDSVLADRLSLTDSTSAGYETWSDNGDNTPILKVYLYNITNPLSLPSHTSPTTMAEVGPFVYRDHRRKFNVSSGEDGALKYKEWQYFEYVPALSIGDPSLTLITTVNLLVLGSYYGSQHCSSWDLQLVYQMFNATYDSDYQRLFTTKTAHEIIFGYTEFDSLAPGIGINNTYTGVLANKSLADSEWNGVSVIGTSDSDAHQYRQWNNMTSLETPPIILCPDDRGPVWASDLANAVTGSDGARFPVASLHADADSDDGDNAQSPLLFYYPYQRTIPLSFQAETHYKDVRVERYQFPDGLYDNVTNSANNSDYYQYSVQGTLNLTQLSGYVPSFVSKPRYLPSLSPSPSASVSVLYGNDSVSDTVFDIEPLTGLTVHLRTSSQLNILIQPLAFADQPAWFASIPPTLIPLLWMVEETGVSDSDADMLALVQDAVIAVEWAPTIFYPLASLLVVTVFMLGSSMFLRHRSHATVNSGVNDRKDYDIVTEKSRLAYDRTRSTYDTIAVDDDDTSHKYGGRRLRIGYRYDDESIDSPVKLYSSKDTDAAFQFSRNFY